MTTQVQFSRPWLAFVIIALVAVTGCNQQEETTEIELDHDDIGGVVTSSNGPEPGVWVIAETDEFPTVFTQIVVTDDDGRYLLPDLPEANYQIFVRGYGLADSVRVVSRPGNALDLTAVVANDPKVAAEVYPASYWLSLLKVPEGEDSPEQVVREIKDCLTCHPIGGAATRTLPETIDVFDTTLDAWERRVQSGQMGGAMASFWRRLGDQRVAFADWSDRIASGEFPTESPPRPSGLERNVVITMWDWAGPTSYVHDEAAADKRHPSGAATRPIYGAVQSDDLLAWVDPITHTDGGATVPTRDPDIDWGGFGAETPLQPSPYWGEERIWTTGRAQPRNATIDSVGRVWVSVRIRDPQRLPTYCGEDSGNPYAQYFAPSHTGKQLARYDPAVQEWTLVDTCFATEHLELVDDTSDTLISSGLTLDNEVWGWVNSTTLEETGEEELAQGWCPAVLDTNGDGEITTDWTEPGELIDPTRDHRITFGCYAIGVSPTDGSTWCSASSIIQFGPSAPGGPNNKIVRLERGDNPPETCKAEVFEPPVEMGLVADGGIDVDSQGVVWVNWRGTDQISSFDRTKCQILNGPSSADGYHCPEGWTSYRWDGPKIGGTELNSDLSYLLYVDRHGSLGVGQDTVVTQAVNSDSLLALIPQTGDLLTLRVPYPMGGMHGRSSHGRIDNEIEGWKGRGLFTSMSSYALWHMEGGPGSRSKVVKFQVRPDPLAK